MKRWIVRCVVSVCAALLAGACPGRVLPAALCGDGRVEGAEACDDGKENGDARTFTDHCNTRCSAVLPAFGQLELLRDIDPRRTGVYARGFATLGNRVLFAGIQNNDVALFATDTSTQATEVLQTFPHAFLFDTRDAAALDGHLYFQAADAVWRTDGSATGTALVAEVDDAHAFAVLHNAVYFLADGPSGRAVYRTDGTTTSIAVHNAATALVALPDALVLVSAGGNVWGSDGTDDGTGQLWDFPGSAGEPGSPHSFAVVGSHAFFFAEASNSPYVTDGTAAGTVQLSALFGGSPAGDDEATPRFLAVDGGVVFLGRDAALAQHLIFTDGTPAGTHAIDGAVPDRLLASDGTRAFFSASTLLAGLEPWVTDGTSEGTHAFGDFVQGPASSRPADCAVVGGRLLCAAEIPLAARLPFASDGVYLSDGTTGGTQLVMTTGGGYPRGSALPPRALTAVGSHVYFSAGDAAYVDRPYVTDGTAQRTRPVAPFLTAPVDSFFPAPRSSGSIDDGLAPSERMIFFANDGVAGFEPWVTDGTRGGTALLVDLVPGHGSGVAPGAPFDVVMSGAFFFPANGNGLYRSDATAAGTWLLTDLPIGAGDGALQLVAAPTAVFFGATDAAHGHELWTSDGTAEGTALFVDLNPSGDGLFATSPIIPFNGGAVVAGRSPLGDGTFFARQQGAVRLSTDAVQLAAVAGDRIAFTTGTSTLHVSDGTTSATHELAMPRLSVGADVRAVAIVAVDDAFALFTAEENGAALWRTDGTEAGTQLVARFVDAQSARAVRGRLYFVAADSDGHGHEPWVSDLTPAGTHLLADIAPGPGDGTDGTFVAVDDRVYFSGRSSTADGVIERNLWVSDGTPAGTRLVVDLAPGGLSMTYPVMRIRAGLVVAATDGATGLEPWLLRAP